MNDVQYLLGKIAEEAAEVGHRAIKAQRFGLDEAQPGQALTNLCRLIDELYDLEVAVELLHMELGLAVGPMPESERVDRQHRVWKHMEYSRECGQLADKYPDRRRDD